MDFNVTEYKKFTDMISDFTFQLAFKKLSLLKVWCRNKDCLQWPKKTIKIVLSPPNHIPVWGWIFIHTSIKTKYHRDWMQT